MIPASDGPINAGPIAEPLIPYRQIRTVSTFRTYKQNQAILRSRILNIRAVEGAFSTTRQRNGNRAYATQAFRASQSNARSPSVKIKRLNGASISNCTFWGSFLGYLRSGLGSMRKKSLFANRTQGQTRPFGSKTFPKTYSFIFGNGSVRQCFHICTQYRSKLVYRSR